MPESSRQARFTIRPATAADCDLLAALIRELAEYEKLAHQVEADGATLHESLFGNNPVAAALIAEADGEPAGYAVFFSTFSTFTGKAGLYLEDIYVRPAWRNVGLGKTLFQRVAQIAVERGCPRLEWAVLDWNEPAIAFYRKLGAKPLSEWLGQRLTAPALDAVAAGQQES